MLLHVRLPSDQAPKNAEQKKLLSRLQRNCILGDPKPILRQDCFLIGKLRSCLLQGLNSLREVIQVLSDARTNQGLNLTSLQLSLVQRDFDEHDYDSLLALDLEVGRSKQELVSQEYLQKLTTFKHPAR